MGEERFIEKTIQSMIQQTILPIKWVIVNDGSTDNTGNIVKRYLSQYRWMDLVEIPQRRDRSFAKKVHSFNAGLEMVKEIHQHTMGEQAKNS